MADINVTAYYERFKAWGYVGQNVRINRNTSYSKSFYLCKSANDSLETFFYMPLNGTLPTGGGTAGKITLELWVDGVKKDALVTFADPAGRTSLVWDIKNWFPFPGTHTVALKNTTPDRDIQFASIEYYIAVKPSPEASAHTCT